MSDSPVRDILIAEREIDNAVADASRESSRILDAIGSAPWAIQPASLAQIVAIATRVNERPEAVATRLGRPLDNARKIQAFGSTALIPVSGPIFRYANLFTEISGATSLEILARDFQTALDDPQIERIVLSLDSPGGQSTGIAEFADLVRASAKPVTAYVGDLAASAAYWIASHAQEIVASPTAMLGSIGVVMTYRPSKDAPIEIVSTQSPLKRAAPDSEHGRLEAQRIVDELAAVFVQRVAAARGVSEETVLSGFGRGSLLVGEAAAAAGMANRVGSLNSLLYPSAPAAGVSTNRRHFAMSEKTEPGAPTIDRAYLDANHADLVAAIRAEGEAAGRSAELKRSAEVRAQLLPGHDALIERLAADGKTTGPEAALAVLAAEKALLSQEQAAILARPAAVPAAPAPDKADELAQRRTAVKSASQKIAAQVSGAAN